jgi:hypothetical protein
MIKKMTVPHCARGPKGCDKCKEATKDEKICLLRIYLKAGNIARPMTEIVVNGEKILCEYDVMKIFTDEREANDFAKKNNINIIFSS